MNWIDFNIICVGARVPRIYNNQAYTIDVMNNNCNKPIKCYVRNWDVLNRIQGIWYELWSAEEKYDEIIKSTWHLEKSASGETMQGYQLYIDEDYAQLLSDILKFYINNSPIKKIIVLFRHQGYEFEQIYKSMSVQEFLFKLLNKEIFGNVAYLVTL